MLAALSPHEAVRDAGRHGQSARRSRQHHRHRGRVKVLRAARRAERAGRRRRRPRPRPPAHPALWGMMAVCVLARVGAGRRCSSTWRRWSADWWRRRRPSSRWCRTRSTSAARDSRSTSGSRWAQGRTPRTTAAQRRVGGRAVPDGSAIARGRQGRALDARLAAVQRLWRAGPGGAGRRATSTSAVRQYALAISFMMSEIRHQPSRKDQRDRSVLDM